MDALSERWLGHTPIPFKDVAGSGKSAGQLRPRRDRPGDDLCRRGRRRDAAALAGAEAAPRRQGPGLGLRAAGAAAGAGAGAHGRARHLGRPADPVAAVGRVGAAAPPRSRTRSTSSPARRFTIGSPKQLGDILFGRMGLPGGTKTKTGQWSTTAQVLEELAAEGHELPRKIVDWRQLTKLKSTYTDALPGYIHPETKRVHTSYALAATTTGRLSSDRAEPAEHPDPHRGRPQDPHGLHRRDGQQADLGRLQPDRAARARPCRRHSAAAGRPSPTASTSTR